MVDIKGTQRYWEFSILFNASLLIGLASTLREKYRNINTFRATWGAYDPRCGLNVMTSKSPTRNVLTGVVQLILTIKKMFSANFSQFNLKLFLKQQKKHDNRIYDVFFYIIDFCHREMYFIL